MVYGTQITVVTVAFVHQQTHHWGAPINIAGDEPHRSPPVRSCFFFKIFRDGFEKTIRKNWVNVAGLEFWLCNHLLYMIQHWFDIPNI